MIKLRAQPGFTIVEILVVIVVIAVLAAVTVVAYNGTTDRANMSVATSTLGAYVKALKLYKADNGRYPMTGGITVCLGSTSDYPAKDGFADGQCQYRTYDAVTLSLHAAASSELKLYMNDSLPSAVWPPASQFYSGTGTAYYRGIMYSAGFLANQGSTASVWFYFRGNQKCPPYANGVGYISGYNVTLCIAQLD